MENSKIAWTHHTFNPWIGCTKVHTGCKNCYAEQLATTRLGVQWGENAARRVTSSSNWQQPRRWARAAAKAGERHRVFCASLADVLDERAPTGAQRLLWDLIRDTVRLCSAPAGVCRDGHDGTDMQCPHCGRAAGGLDWLLLTKRPERWELIPEDVRPLVWLGTSISDQKTADEFVPRLLQAQGFAKRFLSAEPLVGPVDLLEVPAGLVGTTSLAGRGIDWVIVGGESGHRARRFQIEWGRSLAYQCKAANVPCFVKQLGGDPWREVPPSGAPDDGGDIEPIDLEDPKGGEWSEWPEDLRVREFPR